VSYNFSLDKVQEEIMSLRYGKHYRQKCTSAEKSSHIGHPIYFQLSVDKIQDAPFPLQEFRTGTPIL